MKQILLETYFWYFLFYSFIGYLCEIIYCSIPAKRFVNRGFLHGPYLPVYGFGGLAVIVILSPLKSFPVLVFILGMLITSLVEYIAGFLLETIFHTRLWNYSHYRFHIRGRVCLVNTLLFGLLAVGSIYLIHPFIENLLALFPSYLRTVGAFVMLMIMAVDTTVSAFNLLIFTETVGRLQRLKKILESPLNRVTQSHQRFVELLEKERAQIQEQLRKSGKRLFDAFPGMHSPALDGQFKLIREMIKERREKRRKNDDAGTTN